MNNVVIAVLALALGACANTSTTGSNTARQPLEEKEYRTGSRIPVRDPVSSPPTKSLDPAAMNPSAAPRPM